MSIPEKIYITDGESVSTRQRIEKMYLHEYVHIVSGKDNTPVMIVTRVMGGWLYELYDSDRHSKKWQPVFVPEQIDWAQAIQEGINSALENLPQGFIPVRQT